MEPPAGALRATSSICQRVHRPGAALLILLMAAALGGCGSEEPGGAGGTPATTAAPASTAAGPATSEPVVLADGRHPVHLKTVDPDRPTITFDLIQFFTGEAATKAAAEDGEESPPPNDYYIRNVNSRLRTLPVRSDAPITVNVLAAQSELEDPIGSSSSWSPDRCLPSSAGGDYLCASGGLILTSGGGAGSLSG